MEKIESPKLCIVIVWIDSFTDRVCPQYPNHYRTVSKLIIKRVFKSKQKRTEVLETMNFIKIIWTLCWLVAGILIFNAFLHIWVKRIFFYRKLAKSQLLTSGVHRLVHPKAATKCEHEDYLQHRLGNREDHSRLATQLPLAVYLPISTDTSTPCLTMLLVRVFTHLPQ